MRKLATHELPRPDLGDLEALPRHPVSGLLDNIRSLYNVGSIFRTADAAGLEHLYLSGYTGTPENPRLHKTALGAQEMVPWSYASDPREQISALRAQGVTIAVLEQTTERTLISDLTLDAFPLCMVVGNEVEGVQEEVVAAADHAIEIPQFGAKHSLNVSVAFGIAAYDLVRRYRELKLLASRT